VDFQVQTTIIKPQYTGGGHVLLSETIHSPQLSELCTGWETATIHEQTANQPSWPRRPPEWTG